MLCSSVKEVAVQKHLLLQHDMQLVCTSQTGWMLACLTFSGSLFSISFLFLRLAAGTMSAADTGGLFAVWPATGAGEGGRTAPEEKPAAGLAIATACFPGGLF